MSDYTPVNADKAYTLTASAAITGGQLVSASGAGTAAPSTTGDHSIGVAMHDAPNGGRFSIWPLSGYVHELAIQNTLVVAAGGPVVAGTAGTIGPGSTLAAAAAAGTLLGIGLTGGTGNAGLTVKARFLGIA